MRLCCAFSGNGTLDMCKDDNGNNMLNLNEEIKKRVEDIRVKTNINVICR